MTLPQRLAAVPQRPQAASGRADAAPALFRLLAESALARAAVALLFPEDPAAERLFREAGAQLALLARRGDGSAACVDVSAGSLRGVDGRVTHWVLAFADRTELEQLRGKLDALRAAASGV